MLYTASPRAWHKPKTHVNTKVATSSKLTLRTHIHEQNSRNWYITTWNFIGWLVNSKILLLENKAEYFNLDPGPEAIHKRDKKARGGGGEPREGDRAISHTEGFSRLRQQVCARRMQQWGQEIVAEWLGESSTGIIDRDDHVLIHNT